MFSIWFLQMMLLLRLRTCKKRLLIIKRWSKRRRWVHKVSCILPYLLMLWKATLHTSTLNKKLCKCCILGQYSITLVSKLSFVSPTHVYILSCYFIFCFCWRAENDKTRECEISKVCKCTQEYDTRWFLSFFTKSCAQQFGAPHLNTEVYKLPVHWL